MTKISTFLINYNSLHRFYQLRRISEPFYNHSKITMLSRPRNFPQRTNAGTVSKTPLADKVHN